jgi:hypothetical protein
MSRFAAGRGPRRILFMSSAASASSESPQARTHPLVLVILANLVATDFMTGVIWFVQIVHYPLMAGWPHDDFDAWAAVNMDRTGWVVMPVMLVEGAAAAALLVRRPKRVPAWLPWLAAALLLGVWASTFLLQVPCHARLALGWDEQAHARLVATNWIRTLLWTARLGAVAAVAGGWMAAANPPCIKSPAFLTSAPESGR